MTHVKPVEQWGLSDAQAAAKSDLPPTYEVARKMIEGHDHWQKGLLWPGHRTGDAVTDAALLRNVEPQFVADDVVGEVVDNRTNGLIGHEPVIALVPLEPAEEGSEAEGAQQDEVDAIVAALSAWWDSKRLWQLAADALDRVHYAKRASLRAYIAEGNLQALDTTDTVTGRTTRSLRLPTAENLEAALAFVEIEAPAPPTAIRYTDPRTQREVAVILTRDLDDQERAETWRVNDQGLTELRLLGGQERRDPRTGDVFPALPPLDLAGRLPLAEARGRAIVTNNLIKLQSLLNFITTVTGRTVETAGFRERYVGNVEPPGMWLPTPPTNGPPLAVDDSNPGQTYYKHRVPWVLGASITTELIGLRTVTTRPDGTTAEEFTDPTVEALDPVDPAYATNAADNITARIYRRARQGHLHTSGTGEASGVAYEQARAQFLADLDRLRGTIEGMVREILEVALAYAGLMAPTASGILDRYRVVVTLRVNAGPITADEQRLAVELRDKRAISQYTMQGRVGVEDPQAECEAIDDDPMIRADFWTKMAAAITAITLLPGTMMTAQGAGWLLGLTDEQVEVITTGVPPGETMTPEQRAEVEARKAAELGTTDDDEEAVA